MNQRGRIGLLGLMLVALGVGLCQLRPTDQGHKTHTQAVAALADALRAPDPARRGAAFSEASEAAQEAMRSGSSALIALDPYPVFVLQAVEDLRGPPPVGSSPMSHGVAALQRLDLAGARAAFTTASQDPEAAARAALYLRLLNDLAVALAAPESVHGDSGAAPDAQ